MSFGALLKKERERLGLTQGEFAECLGMSQSWVDKAERGARCPAEGTQRRLLSYARAWISREHALQERVDKRGKVSMEVDLSPVMEEAMFVLAQERGVSVNDYMTDMIIRDLHKAGLVDADGRPVKKKKGGRK